MKLTATDTEPAHHARDRGRRISLERYRRTAPANARRHQGRCRSGEGKLARDVSRPGHEADAQTSVSGDCSDGVIAQAYDDLADVKDGGSYCGENLRH